MKKFLFFVLLSLCVCPDLSAGVVVDDPIEDKTGNNGNSGRPRTMPPAVLTSVQDDIVSIDVSRYSGNVQLMVMSEDGVTSISENHSIFGFGTINKDFSLLNAGSYSITLIFDSGEVYVGRVRKD